MIPLKKVWIPILNSILPIMRFFQLASKIPEVYFPSASAKTGKRSLNFVLRWAAKGQMHNKERYIERGVHKEQIRSSEELSWGRMAARTNTNISWLDWSKFCSFIALVGESSAMSSRTSWRPPTAHNSPLPPFGKSCQESTCQPTTIYEHFTSFASIFIAYFLGRQMKRVELAAPEHFPSILLVFLSRLGESLEIAFHFPLDFT